MSLIEKWEDEVKNLIELRMISIIEEDLRKTIEEWEKYWYNKIKSETIIGMSQDLKSKIFGSGKPKVK